MQLVIIWTIILGVCLWWLINNQMIEGFEVITPGDYKIESVKDRQNEFTPVAEVTSYQLPLGLEQIAPPKTRDKKILSRELAQVMAQVTQATNDEREVAYQIEMTGSNHLFKQWAGMRDIAYSETYLNRVSRDTRGIAIALAQRYRQPLVIDLQRRELKSELPPDLVLEQYLPGLAHYTSRIPVIPYLEGMALAKALQLLNPEIETLEEELQGLLAQIEQSRFRGGYNLPGDLEFTRDIGQLLIDRLHPPSDTDN